MALTLDFFAKKRFYVSHNIIRPQVNKYTVKGDFDIEATFDLDTYNIDYRNKDKEYIVLSKHSPYNNLKKLLRKCEKMANS